MDRLGEPLAELLQLGPLGGAARRERPRQQPERLANREPRSGPGPGAIEAGERHHAFGGEERRRELAELRIAAATRSTAALSDAGRRSRA